MPLLNGRGQPMEHGQVSVDGNFRLPITLQRRFKRQFRIMGSDIDSETQPNQIVVNHTSVWGIFVNEHWHIYDPTLYKGRQGYIALVRA